MEPNQPLNDETKTIIDLPDHGIRCTDVLSDTLEGYAGIKEARFDLDNASLKVQFDPRVITQESALSLVRKAGQTARMRVAQCAVKGDAACAGCVAELCDELNRHYSRLSQAAPAQAFFAQNVMEIRLDDSLLPGSELAQAELSMPEREAKRFSLPRERLEIILTTVNALATLLAQPVSRVAPMRRTHSPL